MILHLATVLPAGFLACFQFVPIIRHAVLMFHRLNGYMVILLFLASNAGAYMVIPEAAGGSPATQVALGVSNGDNDNYYTILRQYKTLTD